MLRGGGRLEPQRVVDLGLDAALDAGLDPGHGLAHDAPPPDAPGP
ncbi:hypothetical protein GCM10023203_26850 [Actinomycetospora straminea]|uniref:Uncharacterized protein n=1 Tax=Actinomycetospora straminea TaxID=663607 RepID=A0ABP9EG15_9PSEU